MGEKSTIYGALFKKSTIDGALSGLALRYPWFHDTQIRNPPCSLVCHSLTAMLTFLCGRFYVTKSEIRNPPCSYQCVTAIWLCQPFVWSRLCHQYQFLRKLFLPGLNRRRLTIRPKILLVPRVSQQYGYVSLVCGRGCVVSITSYVDYFTRVKSSETNDMTLPW